MPQLIGSKGRASSDVTTSESSFEPLFYAFQLFSDAFSGVSVVHVRQQVRIAAITFLETLRLLNHSSSWSFKSYRRE
jgi:hypothetical protein